MADVLKIDADGKRDDRRSELAAILKSAVWGENSTRAIGLTQVHGALVGWYTWEGSKRPFDDALRALCESASLGLIVPVGVYWRLQDSGRPK